MDHQSLRNLRLFYDEISKSHIKSSLNLFFLQYGLQNHAPAEIPNAESLPEAFYEEKKKGVIIFYQMLQEEEQEEAFCDKRKQIRLIIDSEYVLTGEVEGRDEDTCLYSAQKNFVTVIKDAMRNEIELIKIKGRKEEK